MALSVQTSPNSSPSVINPDGSPAFPIAIAVSGSRQGSTTAGQSGPLAQGAVTTAAPTYVNGTTNPLSLDASGNLRVTGGGGGGGGAVTAVSGAFVDGSIVTIGTEADAAWSGSGSGTVISVLKKIAAAGGSAVSIADGADVAQGTTTDSAWSGSGASTLVAILKAIYAKVAGTLTTAISGSVAVTGTFWQVTQPVSIASMPSTPVTGTFWQATQPVSGAFFQATQPVSGTFWQATQPVSGTFWQATQPISAASLPLPTNAAQETGGNLATAATTLTAIAAGTPATLGQMPMAKSQPVVIASDQPVPSGDRLRNVFLADQLLFAMNAPMNGFVPIEVPSFLMGL